MKLRFRPITDDAGKVTDMLLMLDESGQVWSAVHIDLFWKQAGSSAYAISAYRTLMEGKEITAELAVKFE